MPQHRRNPVPRAHWSVLLLAVLALFAALTIDGFASNAGGGTAPPGQLGNGGFAPRITEPVIRMDGAKLSGHRMPNRTVALTFDDGPDPEWTPRVLDTLRRHGVQATFFVVGSRVNAHPELARRILADGHELGLHSFSHRELSLLPEWERKLELDLTRTAVARATGRDIRLFRPPYSSTPAGVDPPALRVATGAARDGYVTVLADLDTKDWRRPGANAIASAGAPLGDAGAIVLLHDGGGDRSQTVEALDTLLPTLARRGHRCVTVSAGLSPPAGAAAGRDSPASTAVKLRGWAMAITQRTARWASDALFVLLLFATALALSRMTIQLYCAWRHARRRRHARPDPGFRPPVSVIVPAHNEAANIVATVESLVANGYPELEIIVVDDGSTDGTADLVAGRALPGTRVIRQPNAGKAAALRTGVAAARHDVLVLIDGDTIVEPDTLGLLVQPFRDAAVGAVAGNAKVANRTGVLGRWQHLEYVIAFNLDRRVFEVAECMPTVPGALGAFRRAALAAAGGVSADTLAEDTDLTMGVCRAGWRVVYEDSACAWTEAPGTWRGLFRQRYRWCYGTMQAMWKHRAALADRGASGKLGRRGLSYLLLYQILQPLLGPLVDVYLLYALLFEPLTATTALWLLLQVAQLAVAGYAFRLDRESVGPLWTLALQQVVYRQLIYVVVFQSAVTALVGARMGWHQPKRTGHAAALTSTEAQRGAVAAQNKYVMQQLRRARYRDPLWARICVWAGVLLVAVSGTAAAGGRLLADRYENSVHQADLLGATATYHGVPAGRWTLAGPLNLLLLGVDWRKGQTGLIRADTVMILHVPKTMDRAYLLSLPRDTLVAIPPSAATGFRGGQDRLSAAFAYGAGEQQDRARGGRLLAQTAKQLTGVKGFDGAALIDFYGFTEVIKTMGGVDMCVDTDTTSIHSGVVYRKGCGRMDATSALDYLRQRKTIGNGDYARQRHQQQFLKALVKEARAQNLATDPAKLDRLIRAAGNALTITTGPVGSTEYLFALRRITPERITMIRTTGHATYDAQRQYLGETLQPVSHELFQALRSERLDEFVAQHPELVNRELT